MKRAEKIAEDMVALIRIFHIMKNRAGGAGVKPPPMEPQYWILGFLVKEDLPISEIGRRLQRSKPNMTALVDKLMVEGKVKRLADKEDRRIVRISVTEKGKRFLEDRKRDVKESIKQNLSRLDDKELETLCDSLGKVNRIITKIE